MPQRPRRILYCNSWSTAHGGSSTSLLDIVSALDRKRFDPTVVCPEPGELPTRLRDLGVPVVIHPLSRLNREEAWRFAVEVPWYLKLLSVSDIRLVHGNTSASRRSLLQATALLGIPYVQHVRNGAARPREQFGYRLAKRIITNSEDAATTLRDDPVFTAKTVTIHNAVALPAYQAISSHREALDARNRPTIGFVGQLIPRKGIDTLLRAMPEILATCPTALAVIVGCAPPGEPEYEAVCRSIVTELDIANHVVFTGYKRDVPAWMRTFDVFALPTRSEPFGKVVIEAMAARRPVVASRVGGIPEIITDPCLGTLVPADSPSALARAIVRYLVDPHLAAATGLRAAEHVRANFSLDGMMRKLQDLYDTVLCRSNNGHRDGIVAD
jgi:glycosyltransferase involved in cell wall biosynthesis